MTREPETPLDAVIDDVVRDMTSGRGPDLRRSVANRLEGSQRAFIPLRLLLAGAAVVSILILVLVRERGSREVVEMTPQPRVEQHVRVTEPPRDCGEREPRVVDTTIERVRSRGSIQHVRVDSPQLPSMIEPIALSPIEIDRLDLLDHAGVVPVDVEQISWSPLAVPPLLPKADEEPR